MALFIRCGVMSFVGGILFATILSYGFGLGDWVNVFHGQLVLPVVVVLGFLTEFVSRRFAKQH